MNITWELVRRQILSPCTGLIRSLGLRPRNLCFTSKVLKSERVMIKWHLQVYYPPTPFFLVIGGKWNKRARTLPVDKVKFLHGGWKKLMKIPVWCYPTSITPRTCHVLPAPALEALCCILCPEDVCKARGVLSR